MVCTFAFVHFAKRSIAIQLVRLNRVVAYTLIQFYHVILLPSALSVAVSFDCVSLFSILWFPFFWTFCSFFFCVCVLNDLLHIILEHVTRPRASCIQAYMPMPMLMSITANYRLWWCIAIYFDSSNVPLQHGRREAEDGFKRWAWRIFGCNDLLQWYCWFYNNRCIL